VRPANEFALLLAAELATLRVTGTTSVSPSRTTSEAGSRLALAMTAGRTPYVLAILIRLSPATTRCLRLIVTVRLAEDRCAEGTRSDSPA
jgi:hypothetical protein